MNTFSPATASSSLRHHLVKDMTVRGFSEKTRKYYIRIVAGFADFLERSFAAATAEDIRRFQIHQSALGMGAPAMNSTVAALRFFFTHTLNRPDLSHKLTLITSDNSPYRVLLGRLGAAPVSPQARVACALPGQGAVQAER